MSSIVGALMIWTGVPAASGALYHGLPPLIVSCVSCSSKSIHSVMGAASDTCWVEMS